MNCSINQIGVIALGIGLMGMAAVEYRLATARRIHSALVAPNTAPTRSGFRRVDGLGQAEILVRQYLRSTDESQSPSGAQNAKSDLLRRIRLLDSTVTRDLITSLEAGAGEQPSRTLIHTLLSDLTHDQPEAALTLVTRNPVLDIARPSSWDIRCVSLRAIAEESPQIALDWWKNHGSGLSPDEVDSVRTAILLGIATNDPMLAFENTEQLGLSADRAMLSICGSAMSGDARTSALAALRGYHAAHPDVAKVTRECLAAFAAGIANEGFESGSRWLAEAGLSGEECAAIVKRLPSRISPAERERWMDWICESMEANESAICLREHVSHWAQRDFPAVTEWFDRLRDDDLRAVALKAITAGIANSDPEAASAFGREHGLEK